jgi:RHS repeat-associated protein
VRGDLITWIFEPESFAPIAKLSGNDQHSIITDHLGTPTAMLDQSGNTLWSADISIYGELRNLVGERQACPFRWPGQYEDAETGLYYNRFRYYDPSIAHFLSPDPIGPEGGPRLFGYPGDPLGWVDPLGLAACGAVYQGARDASALLKSQGVPRNVRKQVLASFDTRTIRVRTAGPHEFGIRYFDSLNAHARGRYLFETFPTTRQSLALPPHWNQMKGFKQWQIRPGTQIIEGATAPQGSYYPGGQLQKFVPDLGDLL